jgi:hypothetical protein
VFRSLTAPFPTCVVGSLVEGIQPARDTGASAVEQRA